MKIQITESGKMIDTTLPRVLSPAYAKKLQKVYEAMGIRTVVVKSKWVSSAIINNY
jgi:hypothetical protein